jgi:predicted DNA binding CopG/RHH family protein
MDSPEKPKGRKKKPKGRQRQLSKYTPFFIFRVVRRNVIPLKRSIFLTHTSFFYNLIYTTMNTKNEKRQAYMQVYLVRYRETHHEIKLTFSNRDYEVIRKIAEKQGIRTATFIRQATMEQAKHLYLFPKEIEDFIKQAVRNMRAIGNNINQIAKYCNEQGYSSPGSLEIVFNFLRKMEDEMKNLKRNISKK